MSVVILCLPFTAEVLLAQGAPVAPADSNAKPDRWRGLVLENKDGADLL
jgi:hypothetical protein